MSIIDTLIAVLTLFVCVFGSYYAYRTFRKMTDTNRRAYITGRFEHVMAGDTLYIENLHGCAAEDIRIYLDDIEFAEHPLFSNETLRQRIGPKGIHAYRLSDTQGKGYPDVIRITWKDTSGKPGEFEGDF